MCTSWLITHYLLTDEPEKTYSLLMGKRKRMPPSFPRQWVSKDNIYHQHCLVQCTYHEKQDQPLVLIRVTSITPASTRMAKALDVVLSVLFCLIFLLSLEYQDLPDYFIKWSSTSAAIDLDSSEVIMHRVIVMNFLMVWVLHHSRNTTTILSWK